MLIRVVSSNTLSHFISCVKEHAFLINWHLKLEKVTVVIKSRFFFSFHEETVISKLHDLSIRNSSR